jgi:hypothetical protein
VLCTGFLVCILLLLLLLLIPVVTLFAFVVLTLLAGILAFVFKIFLDALVLDVDNVVLIGLVKLEVVVVGVDVDVGVIVFEEATLLKLFSLLLEFLVF